jgi:hypothetical protein
LSFVQRVCPNISLQQPMFFCAATPRAYGVPRNIQDEARRAKGATAEHQHFGVD